MGAWATSDLRLFDPPLEVRPEVPVGWQRSSGGPGTMCAGALPSASTSSRAQKPEWARTRHHHGALCRGVGLRG